MSYSARVLISPWHDMASVLPSCIVATSDPNERKSSVIVLMSDKRGALVNVSGSSLSNVAGIRVKQAFFAPAMGICPLSGPPPCTKIESITARPSPVFHPSQRCGPEFGICAVLNSPLTQLSVAAREQKAFWARILMCLCLTCGLSSAGFRYGPE